MAAGGSVVDLAVVDLERRQPIVRGLYTLGGVWGASVTAEKVRAREKGVCVKEESIGRSRARHSASPSTSTKYGGGGRRGYEVLNGAGALITAARSLINGSSTCPLRLRRRTHRTITPAFDWNLCSVAQFRRPSRPCCPLILSQRCADGRRHTQWADSRIRTASQPCAWCTLTAEGSPERGRVI